MPEGQGPPPEELIPTGWRLGDGDRGSSLGCIPIAIVGAGVLSSRGQKSVYARFPFKISRINKRELTMLVDWVLIAAESHRKSWSDERRSLSIIGGQFVLEERTGHKAAG